MWLLTTDIAVDGDSGGPFACEHDGKQIKRRSLLIDMLAGIVYLAGIISWGDSCARENQPGIYTMVS